MIDHWKQKLIDFSKKNSLLYFKFANKSHLELTKFSDEQLEHLLDCKAIKLNKDTVETHIDNFPTPSEETSNQAETTGENRKKESLLLQGISSSEAETAEESNDEFSDEEQETFSNNYASESELEPQMASKELYIKGVKSFADNSLIDKSQVDKSLNDPLFLRNKLLERLRSRDRIAKQDLGANILYLAYGFLEWKGSEYSEKVNYSPLFLLPVYIDRSSGLAPKYSLSFCEEEEIVFNPALRMFFKQSFNLSLDFIPEKLEEDKVSLEGLNEYLDQFQEFLKQASYENWSVNKRKCISVFNFQKLVLFKEMEIFGHKMLRHPIISKLHQRDSFEQKDFLSAAEIDYKEEAKENFCVLDADSSQLEAINAAKQGISFVLDGPPGTGKSQTIANIISELLAQGKKILFVSEKKAALNVVKERLEACGLDSFSLVLHDTRKKDKVGFIKRLNECFEKLDTDYLDEDDYEVHFRKLEERKKELNEYAALLHRPFGELKIKPYLAYAKASSLSAFPDVSFPIENILEFDDLKWDKTSRLIQKLSQRKEIGITPLAPLTGGTQNCFSTPSLLEEGRGGVLRIKGYLSLTQKEKLKKQFNQLKGSFENCRNKFNKLFSALGFAVPRSVQDFETHEAFLSHLVLVPDLVHTLVSQESWKEYFHKLSTNKVLNQEYLTLKKHILSYALEGSSREFIQNNLLQVQQFKEMNEAEFLGTDEFEEFKRSLKESFYATSRSIGDLADDLTTIEEDLIMYKNFLVHKSRFEKVNQDLQQGLFDSSNKPDSENKASGEAALEEAKEWLSQLVEFSSQINAKFQEVLQNKLQLRKVKDAYLEAVEARNQAERVLIELDEFCSFYDWKSKEIMSFIELLNSLENETGALDNWIDFCLLEDEFDREGLKGFFELAIEAKLAPQDMMGAFEKRFYTLLIDHLESQHPKLRYFKGEDHNDLIKSFQKLDKEHFQIINRRRVFQKIQHSFLLKKLPPAQLKSLCTLSQQKRPRKSIRRIIKDLRKLVLEVHPCWMMSPLSVSQLIELEQGDNPNIFDTVIFDEASQIFPEDAICSIFRGKQLIVAGDPEQMPPTSFGKFSNIGFDEFNEEEDDENPEFESILNLASVSLKQRKPLRLLWHYRSRYEELIHASNQKIYNGDLITFPASRQPLDRPVKFVYIEDGIFDRGKSKTNPQEAKRVAEYLVSILKEQKEKKEKRKSIGIIALGAAQTECIEDEVNKLRLQNPELEEFFVENISSDQRIFIKNLETVQGDERDIILLSIGYGRDSSGKIYQNFGPINQKEVGHRRLNVAVTRAKQQMVLFSSFHHYELNVTEDHSKGLNFLRDYLCYAETGILAGASKKQSRIAASVYGLKEEIAEQLSKRGLKVSLQVGRSEYKLDLAVLDPQDENKFILGIECDAEMYQSAKTCRDRDRLRKEVLENYGWKIHRVWSRDWWLNPERELEKILSQIDQANSFAEALVEAKAII
ncbi:MAG: DUF4011 domain-containing protein [Candidatus Caenarcaniphilales bacterium]|nr:DUF4011 domain-containing protein [Candidatus Caenarcaniphilales bacterium]